MGVSGESRTKSGKGQMQRMVRGKARDNKRPLINRTLAFRPWKALEG